MGPLQPSYPELVLALVIFAIIFGALGKVILPRIQRTLAQRDDAIEGGLARAEAARRQAEETLAEYRAQLSEARHEAARIRHTAEEEGARLIAEIRSEGQAQRERMVAEAAARMASDRIAVSAQLRDDIAAAATELAERMTGESLGGRAQTRAVIDAYFAEVDARSAELGSAR